MNEYGHRMTSAPEPAPEPMYQQPPPPPPKKGIGATKIVLIVLAGFFVLLVLFVGGCFLLVNGTTKDAQKVSDDFVVAVQNGDGAKAWSLAGPTFRAATTEAELTELVKRLSGLVTKDKVSPSAKGINASTDTGKIAVFVYKLKGTGQPATVWFKTQIREEDGKWQVLSFRSAESELNTDIE
jgi:hypothetical protein